MSDKFDISNYTESAVPRSYNREVRTMITGAVNLGWTLTVARNQNITLIAPGANKRISLSPRKQSQPLDSFTRTIHKYANPLLVPSEGQAMNRAKQMIHTNDVRENTMRAQEPAAFTPPEEEETVAALMEEPEITVVYEGPMRSQDRHAGNVPYTYESDVATEIEYSDGTREFFCTRCDYHSDKSPRSMSGHWQKHVREDQHAYGGHRGAPVDPPTVTTYNPLQERLESLTEALLAIIAAGEVDWSDVDKAAETLALTALTWQHERQGQGEPQEPLTDAQVLNRIRNLVDGGRYNQLQSETAALTDRISTLETIVEAQKVEVVASVSAYEKVRAERDEARGNLDALRELLDGLRND